MKKKLTSDKCVSLFLISNLKKYLWNLNNYVITGVFFKDLCTEGQPEKNMQVKRSIVPFLLLFFKW